MNNKIKELEERIKMLELEKKVAELEKEIQDIRKGYEQTFPVAFPIITSTGESGRYDGSVILC